MKKILQELQSIQDECIGRIKKEENGQLPKRVAGALIRSVKNTTTWEEWNLIRENIDNHSKDWRRFQKDPNKIVLEKNFFFNTLKKMGGLFIFRPSDDNGATYINPSDFFLTSKPRYWGALEIYSF